MTFGSRHSVRLLIWACAVGFIFSASTAHGFPFVTSNPTPQIVFDAHEESLRLMHDTGLDYSQNMTANHGDIDKWRRGKVNAVWLAAWVNPQRQTGQAAVERTLALLKTMERCIAQSGGRLVLCTTASDVRRAAGNGKIAIIPAVEGGISLNDDVSLLKAYRKLGVRRMNLTWNNDLSWATAALGTAGNSRGLSPKGVEVVREMNRLGIVPDLSHASDKTIEDTLAVATKPVICSHSNARALHNSPRNIPDNLARKIAAKGGVIGVNFYPPHLGKGGDLNAVVRHIQHFVNVCGIDHVGVGSDWDGIETTARGLEDASKMPNLIAALYAAGYSRQDVAKIVGENFLRVLAANE